MLNLYGELRTRNVKADDKNKLMVFGYVTQGNQQVQDFNQVTLRGFVCKTSNIINKKKS